MHIVGKHTVYGVLCISLLTGTLCINAAIAGNVEITPSLALSEKYSNNLFLSDQSKVSDWVTIINPALSVQYQSTNLDVDASYDFYKQLVSSNSYLDMDYHEMSLGFSAYQQNNFSFVGQANIEQQPVTYGGLTVSDIVVGNDFEEVKTGYLSPSYLLSNQRYTASARYVFGVSRYENQSESDNNSHAVSLFMGPGHDRDPLSVSVKLNETIVDYINVSNGESVFTDMFVKLDYRSSSKLLLNYGRGKERHDSDRSAVENEGYYWEAGLTYLPLSYMSLTFSRGEHYYGRSYSGLLSYERARLVIKAEYGEETTSSASTISVDSNGEQVEPDFRSYLTVRNDILLTKTFTSSVQYRLHQMLLRYSNEAIHRISQEVSSFDRSYTHRVSATYQMPRNTTLRLMYDYARLWRHPADSRINDGILSVNVQRQINPQLRAAITLSDQSMRSVGGGREYDEFQFMANIEMSF